MDNKAQLQANNERIAALTEIIKNKSAGGGSGGLEINGILQQCKVGKETVITKGDFVRTVDFVEKSGTAGLTGVNIVKLSENKYVAASMFNSSYKRGPLVYLITCDDNDTITVTNIAVTQTTNACQYIPAIVKITDDKFAVFCSYGSSYYLYGSVITVNGTSMTASSLVQLGSSSINFNQHSEAILYDENKIALFGTYATGKACQCHQIQVNDDNTLTVLSTTRIGGDFAIYRMPKNPIMIDDENIIILLATYDTNGTYTNTFISKFNVNTLTSVDLINRGISYGSSCNYTMIDNKTILFVSNDKSSNLNAYIIDIENPTINPISLETTQKISTRILKISETDFIFGSIVSSKQFNIVTLHVEDGMVYIKSNKPFNISVDVGIIADLLYDSDKNRLLVADIGTFSIVYLIPVAYSIKNTSDVISAVSKDSGKTEDLIDVIVPNV